MDNMHEGGCLCGSVRYRVQGEPAIGMVCHCRFCQRRLATAFAMIAYFAENQVEMLQGELSTYEHRSDETSRWLRLQFCPRCGTTICHTAEARPGFRGIAAGTFDDPDWFKIERHIWTRSARPWVSVPAGVQVFDQAFQPQQK
jgi:hypothetical protein